MTGGYQLLLPTLWVCLLSFIFSDRQSIYSEQVECRSRSPAHQGSYVRDAIGGVNVRQFLKAGPEAPTLHPGDSLTTVLGRVEDMNLSVLPVIDADRRLLGVINLDEVYLASRLDDFGPTILADDLMRTDIEPLTPDDPLERAQELFVENDLLVLPIVNDLVDRKLIGMIRRFDIANAYLRCLQGPTPQA
jgi:CIC family chloride channel protein